MKNLAGKIIGFIIGMCGFLLLFKLFVLPNIAPEDEMAPGMVLIAGIIRGLFFAFIGSLLQNRLKKTAQN